MFGRVDLAALVQPHLKFLFCFVFSSSFRVWVLGHSLLWRDTCCKLGVLMARLRVHTKWLLFFVTVGVTASAAVAIGYLAGEFRGLGRR